MQVKIEHAIEFYEYQLANIAIKKEEVNPEYPIAKPQLKKKSRFMQYLTGAEYEMKIDDEEMLRYSDKVNERQNLIYREKWLKDLLYRLKYKKHLQERWAEMQEHEFFTWFANEQ
jgi:hypothetical protein